MRSRKKQRTWKEFPFLTEAGIQLIKLHTKPRTCLGMGLFGSYKDYGESDYRIGYGSISLWNRRIGMHDKATQEEVEKQLVEDLKIFSCQVAEYVYVPLNRSRKGAVLSFAHSIGLLAFKNSRLLELINSHASKTEIIKEWSPYINRYWLSGGDGMRDRRRAELDLFLSADKKIPTFTKHKCHTPVCLLNLPDTFTGAPNQVKAVEYLEKKLNEWDPSGHVIRRFYRLWSQNPTGQGSLKPREKNALEDQ